MHPELHRAGQPGRERRSAGRRLPGGRERPQRQQGATRRRGAADRELQGSAAAADRRELLL